MSKLLAEWFWTDRWSGSDGWLLPLAPRGLYREMLTQAWKRGARISANPETIRALCNVSESDWKAQWPAVKPFWKQDGDSLINETQVAIYAEAKGKHERAQARAKAGAQAKHNRMPKDKPPSPSLTLRTPGEEPPIAITPGVRGEEDIDELNATWATKRGGPHRYIHECLPAVRAIGLERTIEALEAYLDAKENDKFKGTPSDFAANYRMYLPKNTEPVRYSAKEAVERAR